MSAHRYWMLRLFSRSASFEIFLSTVELREVIGGADIAGSASKTENPITVSAWWDGNDATSGTNNTGDSRRQLQTVKFDFVTAKEINEIRVRTASNAALAPLFVQLFHSDDNLAWTPTSLLGEFPTPASANTNYLFSGWSFDQAISAKVSDSAVRLLGTAPTATNFKLALQPIFLRDRSDGGFGQIIGTVKEKSTPTNVPLRRKVRLFHEFSGRFIRETWSDDAGNYAFTGVDPTQRYTVVSYDHLQNYRAVIADNILPEVMA